MGVFRRTKTVPAASAAIRAEVGAAQGIGNYETYYGSFTREAAMRIPTISRSRDLIASMIAGADIEQYAVAYDPEPVDIPLAPETWMNRPDPSATRAWLLSAIFDDLYFYGRAFLGITSRYQNGFPNAFTWLPASMVQTLDQAGPVWFGISDSIVFNGTALPSRDVVQFISPIQGVLSTGARAITIAQRLDEAAARFAKNEIPSGWLEASSTAEPMSAEELSELAASWSEARLTSSIAALSGGVSWHESSMDPARLQLVEARNYQALELARVGNVPGYLVGAPTPGMTYQNAQESTTALWAFGARPYLICMEQTLSGDNVIPRGRYVRLSLDRYMRSTFDEPTAAPQPRQPNPTENPVA